MFQAVSISKDEDNIIFGDREHYAGPPLKSLLNLETMEIGDSYVIKDMQPKDILKRRGYIHLVGLRCQPVRRFITRIIDNNLYYKRVA